MPKSLKKSWRQSEFQAEDKQEISGAKALSPLQRSPAPDSTSTLTSTSASGFAQPDALSAKPALPIWVAPNLKLLLEARFFAVCGLAILLYLVAGFAGNDWLYLVISGFVAAIILGAIMPLLQVLDVKVDCALPCQFDATEDMYIKLKLSRRQIFGTLCNFLPIAGIRGKVNVLRRTADGAKYALAFTAQPFVIDSLTEESWLRLPIPQLKRGIYKLDRLELLSCFPFGVTWWSRSIQFKDKSGKENAGITVYPQVMPLAGNFLTRMFGMRSPMGMSALNSTIVPYSSIFRSVREFQAGDSTKHIHWASTAKHGQLLVREFDSEQLPPFDILLDLRSSWVNQEQFELAVCLVHSLGHFVFKWGTIPQLLLSPSATSQLASQSLMRDLPSIPYGLKLLSEILARVEPLNNTALKNDNSDRATQLEEPQVKSLGDDSKRMTENPLLIVMPAMVSSEDGDPTSASIELAVTSQLTDKNKTIIARLYNMDDLVSL